MSAMERRERRERRERMLRFVICIVLGLGAAALIGQPYTPTTAISAILVLYIDRGYNGSIWYSFRRIRAQFLMGLIVFVLIFLMRSYTELPDWWIMVLATVLTVLIGLPFQERFQIAPYTVTMGNAILIMATGIITSSQLLVERVMACVFGALIGHLVCYVIVPGIDRYEAVCEQLREDGEILSSYLRACSWEKGQPPALKAQTAFLEKQLGYMREDNRFKHRAVEQWRVRLVNGLFQTEKHLIAFSKDLALWGKELTPDFLAAYRTELERAVKAHQELLCRLGVESPPAGGPEPLALSEIPCKNHGEIVAAAYLINYITCLNETDAGSRAPAAKAPQPDPV